MNRLKEVRERLGFTQDRLAHAAGLTVTGYCQIERGEVGPRLRSVQAIAAVLKVPVEEIFPPEPVKTAELRAAE